jgi:hypothetical protein
MRPCLRKGAKFGSAAKDSHLTDFWHNHQQTVNVQSSQFLNPQAFARDLHLRDNARGAANLVGAPQKLLID